MRPGSRSIARGKRNFQLVELVPLCVRSLFIRYGEKRLQAPMRGHSLRPMAGHGSVQPASQASVSIAVRFKASSRFAKESLHHRRPFAAAPCYSADRGASPGPSVPGEPGLVPGLGVVQQSDRVAVRDADQTALNDSWRTNDGNRDERAHGERGDPMTYALASHVGVTRYPDS